MGWAEEISALRRELGAKLSLLLTQAFVSAPYAKSSEIGNDDAIKCSDESGSPQRPVTRGEPFGFRSRPTSKVRSLSLRLGTSNLIHIAILPTQGYGLQDLSDGEMSLYSAFCAGVLYADKNGKTSVKSKAGSTVEVGNGAQHPMPLWDTFVIDLAQVLTAISNGVIQATGQFSPADKGSITAFVTALNVPNYNSQNATNG